MKKLSTNEARKIDGGATKCNICGKNWWYASGWYEAYLVGLHNLTTGHKSFTKYF